jgi:hypothetical protein
MIDNWQVSQVVTTVLEAGFVTVQCQGLGEGASLGYFVLHHPSGFRSQPHDMSDDEQGCSALYGYEGGRGHAWLCGDNRATSLLPDEGKGGSLQYAVVKGQDGTLAKCAYLKLDGGDGSALLRVPDGAAKLRLDYGTGGDGPSVELTSSLVKLTGPQGANPVTVGSAGVDLGGEGGAGVVADVGGALMAWIAGVNTAITGLGGAAPPAPAGIVSTKVRAVV